MEVKLEYHFTLKYFQNSVECSNYSGKLFNFLWSSVPSPIPLILRVMDYQLVPWGQTSTFEKILNGLEEKLGKYRKKHACRDNVKPCKWCSTGAPLQAMVLSSDRICQVLHYHGRCVWVFRPPPEQPTRLEFSIILIFLIRSSQKPS